MSITERISTFTKKFIDPRFRKLAKAGLISFDSEGMKLTRAGRYSLFYILLEQEGVMEQMLEVANERIAEEEESEKN